MKVVNRREIALVVRGLLIFDLDGTLFQTHLVTVPAVERSFGKRGLPVPSAEEICDFFGKPDSEFRAWIRSLCPEQTATEVWREIGRLERALIPEKGKLYPEVYEVLTSLRSSVAQMAICSNGSRGYVEAVLSSQSLDVFFDAVRCRQSGQDNKPSMVAELLRQLRGRPGLVIGDRHDDIDAAHSNGLGAIAATYGYGSAEELISADAAVASPAELRDLVVSLLCGDVSPAVDAD